MSVFPTQFVNQMQEMLGNEANQLFEAIQTEPLISISINSNKIPPATYNNPVPWNQQGFYLSTRPEFSKDPYWHAGNYYVQEPSSQFVSYISNLLLKNFENPLVLDLCAAPGGKSLLLLSQMKNKGLLISNEVIRTRVGILKENILKFGATNCIVTNSDPEAFEKGGAVFDMILIDAPCSGEGLFRRQPQSMQQWNLDLVKLCAARQQRILKSAWKALAPGGFLIYSTCTYNKTENEDNVDFLFDELGALPVEIETNSEWNIQQSNSKTASFRFWPHKLKGEGYFLSVVQKPGVKVETDYRTKQNYFKADWLKEPMTSFITKNKKHHFLVESQWADFAQYLNKFAEVYSTGLEVTTKGNETIPAPESVFSSAIDTSFFKRMELDLPSALKYLNGQALALPTEQKGFALMYYENAMLGMANLLGNRVNNLFPKEWRLRKL